MKLKDSEKYLLLKWGYSEEDFKQIEEAMGVRNTTYTYCHNGIEEKISREKAYELLGMRNYLSGIGRSTFHWSATRFIDDKDSEKGYVEFDSSRLFRQN